MITATETCSEVGKKVDLTSLASTNFWLDISFGPDELRYKLTGLYLPGIRTSSSEFGESNVMVKEHGDTLSFEPLVIEFIVSRNLKNWHFIYNWMKSNTTDQVPMWDAISMNITTTDNENNPTKPEMKIVGPVPTDLSGMRFNFNEPKVDIKASATFDIQQWIPILE